MTADPGDAGPIVRLPMGLPITAGCDTAWIRTRDCSDASCTEMQINVYLSRAEYNWNTYLQALTNSAKKVLDEQ